MSKPKYTHQVHFMMHVKVNEYQYQRIACGMNRFFFKLETTRNPSEITCRRCKQLVDEGKVGFYEKN